jgi:hypothetical protein
MSTCDPINCAGKAASVGLFAADGAFQRGSIVPCLCDPVAFDAPNMKSIPVRTVRIAGLQGE